MQAGLQVTTDAEVLVEMHLLYLQTIEIGFVLLVTLLLLLGRCASQLAMKGLLCPVQVLLPVFALMPML